MWHPACRSGGPEAHNVDAQNRKALRRRPYGPLPEWTNSVGTPRGIEDGDAGRQTGNPVGPGGCHVGGPGCGELLETLRGPGRRPSALLTLHTRMDRQGAGVRRAFVVRSRWIGLLLVVVAAAAITGCGNRSGAAASPT